MSTMTIPLGAVRVALTGALIKIRATEVHARTVAMTSYNPLARCCGSRRLHVDAKTVHFGVMESGELPAWSSACTWSKARPRCARSGAKA